MKKKERDKIANNRLEKKARTVCELQLVNPVHCSHNRFEHIYI